VLLVALDGAVGEVGVADLAADYSGPLGYLRATRAAKTVRAAPRKQCSIGYLVKERCPRAR
jgi:hypothetical protein